jgi:CRISPR-associated helicase Cas3
MSWYRVLEKVAQAKGQPFEERALQRRVVDELQRLFESIEAKPSSSKPILIRLPCGYGKTIIGEAPLLGEAYQGKWITKGLTYVLPTRALTEEQRRTVETDVGALCRIKGIKGLDVESFHSETDTYYFYADAAVSTFDTFIYAYARKSRTGHHLEFPAGTIATSYVVFDEAHMIQDEYLYSHTVMNRVLRVLAESGVPTIVMTATMPEPIKDAIFDGIEYDEVCRPEDVRAQLGKYRGEITACRLHGERLSEYVRRNLSLDKVRGRRILIVCNTVKEAQEVFKHLRERLAMVPEDKGRIILLHSRLAEVDRKGRTEEAIMLMGKGKCKDCGKTCDRLPIFVRRRETTEIYCERCRKQDMDERVDYVIVIATQVVEAGLNVTSDWLLTDCAPLDAIVQRSGRCARFPGEKGEVDIFYHDEVYRPYPRGLVEGAFKVLKEEDPAKCLMDFVESIRMINDGYRGFKGGMLERRLRLYLSYLEGQGFSTFSVDWNLLEEIEARPSSPLNVVALTPGELIPAYELKTTEEWLERGGFRLGVARGPAQLTYEGLLMRLKEGMSLVIDSSFVRSHLFTLDMLYASKNGEPKEFLRHEVGERPTLLELRLVSARGEDKETTYNYYYLIQMRRAGKLTEGTYLLSPRYYDKVLGLKLDE